MTAKKNSAKARTSDPEFQRFVKDNVRSRPEDLASLSDDSAPEPERVSGSDLYPLGKRDVREVHGALYRPATTLLFPSAALGRVGFPEGYTQAKAAK